MGKGFQGMALWQEMPRIFCASILGSVLQLQGQALYPIRISCHQGNVMFMKHCTVQCAPVSALIDLPYVLYVGKYLLHLKLFQLKTNLRLHFTGISSATGRRIFMFFFTVRTTIRLYKSVSNGRVDVRSQPAAGIDILLQYFIWCTKGVSDTNKSGTHTPQNINNLVLEPKASCRFCLADWSGPSVIQHYSISGTLVAKVS